MTHHAKASSAGSTEGSGKRKRRGPVLAVFALAICALALTAAPALAANISSTMGPITSVSYGSAHVSGTVSSGLGGTTWRFDYSTDGVNWIENVPNASGGPVERGDTTVEADLTGLKGGTKYFVRLAAVNGALNEIAFSPEPNPEFTTLVADPPSVETIDNASEVEYNIAEVSGKVNRPANSNDLTCNFEYVTDAQFTGTGFQGASLAACGPIATIGSSTVSAQLTGLSSGTTYHLRLAVANASASDSKEAAPFTTQTPTAPALVLNPPTEVKYTTAHISGSVDPEGGNIQAGEPLPIHWELQSTPDPVEYGWFYAAEGTIEGAAAEGSNPIPVSTNLGSLQNGREYKFRLVVSSAGSVAISPEGSFVTEAVSAPIVEADDATAVTGTTAHFSGEVTAGNADPAFNAACAFDYVTDKQFQIDQFSSAQRIACAPLDPVTGTVNGVNAVAVHADPTGLEPNTVYHLRLRAENQGGQNTDVANTFETDAIAPTVQTLFASQIAAHSALLGARVNPHNSTVTYQFEWGTDGTYGSFAPASPTLLGASDNSLHVKSVQIGGLQEGTAYHFRIVATNTETNEITKGADRVFTTTSDSGPSSCPNEQRRAESNSLALPECRGYELVMPSVKDFPFGRTNSQIAVASREGDAVAYETFGPMPGSVAGTQENFNISRRGDGGWVNTPLSPPQTPPAGTANYPLMFGLSESLSQMIFQAANPPLAPGAPTDNTPVLYTGNTETQSYTFLGAQSAGVFTYGDWVSEDGSRAVFEVATGQSNKLYESVNGTARDVGVYPNGTVADMSALGLQGTPFSSRIIHAVSDDGRRIVWTDSSQVYDRIDGEETIQISASQRTVPDSTTSLPYFWGASADGDKVYFTSQTALTDDATPGSGSNLYLYDLSSETLTDLTPAAVAAVQGVVGNSDDGEYVYFVAGGALDGDAESGKPNLYLAHAGTVTYIGALAPFVSEGEPGDSGAWDSKQSSASAAWGMTARVSPDGHLAIQSAAPLTGYDNISSTTGQPTSQVYLYSPGSGTLTCASCRPDGTPPAGNSKITPPDYEMNTTRNINSDGSRVFFNSTDAIVPGDTNGKSDVYEWTAGAPHLISDGTSDVNAFFQDASLSGKDVIFSTAARLVGQDTDNHDDLYDARVGGGFARPPAAPVPCEGEACRGAGSAAPGAEAPVTPGFVGPGNPRPQKANSKQQAKALKACRAKHSKKQRKKCESQVKKRFANKSGRGK